MRIIHTALRSILMICVLSTVSAHTWGQTINEAPNILQLASDPFIVRTLYAHPGTLLPDSKIAVSGAVGHNKDYEEGKVSDWYIEAQRDGSYLVQAGVVMHDRSQIEKGLKILKWGFGKQAPDGSFPGSMIPYHSTSLYIEACGRAALIIQQSGIQGFEADVAELIAHSRMAIGWMLEPAVEVKGQKSNSPYCHKHYLVAAAFAQTYQLSKDIKFLETAKRYLVEGLACQDENGINPEKGGFDVNYQAVGIIFAEEIYALHLFPDLEQPLQKMIHRGLDWELSRLKPDGSLDTEGSTRDGKERGTSGKIKEPDYPRVLLAFKYGEIITGEHKFGRAAMSIAQFKKLI